MFFKETNEVVALRRFVASFPRGSARPTPRPASRPLEQPPRLHNACNRERGKASIPVKVLSPEIESALKPQDAFKECDTCLTRSRCLGTFVMGSPHRASA